MKSACKPRTMFQRLNLSLVVSSLSFLLASSLFAVNNNNNPSEPKTPGGDDGGDCPPESGSDNGCVSFGFPFPLFPLEEGLGGQLFSIQRQEPSPGLFTPQSLSYSSIFTTYVASAPELIEDENEVPVAYEFSITNLRNEAVEFRAEIGSSLANTIGFFSHQKDRVVMLDANLDPTTNEPTFLRLFRGDGSEIDYPVNLSQGPVRVKTATGRVIEFGTDVKITLQDGFYRQFKSASGLADIVVVNDFSYEVRLYTFANVGTLGSNDLYQPIGTPYRVIKVQNPTGNSNFYERVRITDTHGGYKQISEWNYVPAAEDWALTKALDLSSGEGLLIEQIVISQDAVTGNEIKETKLLTPNSLIVSRNREIRHEFPWGKRVIEHIKDTINFELTTYTTYHEDSLDTGSYTQKKQVINPDGSWMTYDYDSEGRIIQLIEPWQDSPVGSTASQAKETIYSYTPLITGDVLDAFDARPRTTIIKTLGVETARTYNVYSTDSVTGEFTEIEKRTTIQGASYGAASNLRTTRIYYSDADPVSAGRLKSLTTPDGVVALHTYSQVDAQSDFIETIDRLASTGTVDYKSTRQVLTKDIRGNLIKDESYVHDGTDWQLYSTTEQDFSDQISAKGFQLTERRKDGRITLEQGWGGPLLNVRRDETGIHYFYNYDSLDRLEMEMEVGAIGSTAIISDYSRSLGALDCGCDGTRSMDRTAGGMTVSTFNKTDSAGRPSQITDENDYTTTYSYVDDQRIVTMTAPNDSTRITEKYLDGRLKSITGTGVIPEYYTYAVATDGTTTTRVEVASVGSPRYSETTYDLAGRLIREENPAFAGGTILREMSYNNLGLLASSSLTGQADTLYEYDSLSNLIRTGIDIDDNASLDLASTDRITDTDRFMEQDGAGDWFDVTTTTVYPENSSTTAVEVSRSARRLSNFALATSLGDLVSESRIEDVHGNVTTRTTHVDRTTKDVTEIINTPDSDIDVTRITNQGLLISQNSHTVLAPTVYSYDALQRLISIQEPRHAQPSTIDYYDGTLQVFTETDSANNTTAYTYYGDGQTGAGQVASMTNPLLEKSYQSYDLFGRQVQTWGETDYPQAYSYTIYGELASLTTWRDSAGSIDFSTATWPNPTGGDTTTWSYQASTGLLTRKEYADTNGTDYTYDSANRLAIRTWARDGGLDTTYSYDVNTSELLNVNYEAIDTADITYTYDRLGRQSSITDATGTRNFAYNSSTLQLDTETLDSSFYQGYTLERSYQDGTESNGLTGRSKGYSLTDSTSSTLTSVIASLTAPQHTVTYAYEPNRNVMTSIDNQISSSSLSKYAYTYDVFNKDSFTYNSRSEVTGSLNDTLTSSAYNLSYAYDDIGNRLSSNIGITPTNYTSNALNQYSAITPFGGNPIHDLDGNLTSHGNGSGSYTWNNENRLSNALKGLTSIDFVYDYQGRLVWKYARCRWSRWPVKRR